MKIDDHDDYYQIDKEQSQIVFLLIIDHIKLLIIDHIKSINIDEDGWLNGWFLWRLMKNKNQNGELCHILNHGEEIKAANCLHKFITGAQPAAWRCSTRLTWRQSHPPAAGVGSGSNNLVSTYRKKKRGPSVDHPNSWNIMELSTREEHDLAFVRFLSISGTTKWKESRRNILVDSWNKTGHSLITCFSIAEPIL